MIWIFQFDWLMCLEKILVILDNLGWYCDVTNVYKLFNNFKYSLNRLQIWGFCCFLFRKERDDSWTSCISYNTNHENTSISNISLWVYIPIICHEDENYSLFFLNTYNCLEYRLSSISVSDVPFCDMIICKKKSNSIS